MLNQLKIKIENGLISLANYRFVKKTKCRYCGQDIYIIKTNYQKSIIATKINGEYFNHSLYCPFNNSANLKNANFIEIKTQ